MSNYKPGIYIIRHGARTSSSIGRKDDYLLSRLRKGLTPFGYAQSMTLGSKFNQNLSKNLNMNSIKENTIYLISTNSQRINLTSIGFLEGFLDINKINNEDYVDYHIDEFHQLDFSNVLADREKYHILRKNGNNIFTPNFYCHDHNYKKIKETLKNNIVNFEFMNNNNKKSDLIREFFKISTTDKFNYSEKELLNICNEFMFNKKYFYDFSKINKEYVNIAINYNKEHMKNNLFKINDDNYIDKKNSLSLEKNLTKKFDFDYSKNMNKFPIKDLIDLFFNELKIDSNGGNLYFYEIGQPRRSLDMSFFDLNNIFFESNLKKLVDFIKCNIMYEEIPIYKEKYIELIQHIKVYLFDTYYSRYENYSMYRNVYYSYGRNIFLSMIDLFKHSKNKDETSDIFLLFFGHHRTQNSLLRLLIPIKNFQKLFEDSLENRNKFIIISNIFCGILRLELFENPDFAFKKNVVASRYLGYKIFYEDYDISNMIHENLLGRVQINSNSENFKNECFLDMTKFEAFISTLEEEYVKQNMSEK